MSAEVVQTVTSKKSDIPSHFIPISSFGCHKGNTDKKASDEYKAIYRAWCDERIGGIKLMHNVHDKRGQIFIDPADAKDVIEHCKPPRPALPKAGRDSSQQMEALLCALSTVATNQTTALHAIERIADALEKISEHPLARLEDVGVVEDATEASWRDIGGRP